MILLEPGNRILEETVATQIKPPSAHPPTTLTTKLIFTRLHIGRAAQGSGQRRVSHTCEHTAYSVLSLLCVVACCSEQLADESEAKPTRQPIDIKLCDFDDVSYRVLIDHTDLNTMRVSIQLPCFHQVKDHGAQAAAEKLYPGLVVAPDPQYDVTLAVPLNPLPTTPTPTELITRLSLLKSTLVGGVFDAYFTALLSATPLTSTFTFSLRSDTQLYFIPKADRVTVIFSLAFQEETDRAIARIFMQEFVEVKRRLGAAPPCTFSNNQPLELKEFGSAAGSGSSSAGFIGYISFAVLKNHLEGGKKEKVVATLQSFRSYLQYHIKCSKSYFHARMRARVVSLLKVLSRAKQDRIEDKEKKTMSGRTFVRS